MPRSGRGRPSRPLVARGVRRRGRSPFPSSWPRFTAEVITAGFHRSTPPAGTPSPRLPDRSSSYPPSPNPGAGVDSRLLHHQRAYAGTWFIKTAINFCQVLRDEPEWDLHGAMGAPPLPLVQAGYDLDAACRPMGLYSSTRLGDGIRSDESLHINLFLVISAGSRLWDSPFAVFASSST